MAERSEQETIRFNKLEELRSTGFSFPNDVKVSAYSKDLPEKLNEETPAEGERATLAGRIVQIRLMGKAAFCHILDEFGKYQVYVRKDSVGEDSYALFKKFDIGDIIEISGYVFKTKTGEISLFSESIRLLTKSLIPLPEKWHGLSDTELRYRQRYVDLIANWEGRNVFRKRAEVIKEIRSFLDERDYLEVETPILHYVAGGTIAKPFETFYNSLHCSTFLRIALELPLKKLIVGGFHRVYELGRAFRNEGISKKHNPEFTMLEFYQAYATFEDLMDLTEELFEHLAKKITGGVEVQYGEKTINFARPWKRISMLDSIYEYGDVGKEFDLNKLEDLQKIAELKKIELKDKDDWGRSLETIYGELVEHQLTDPVFLMHHPYSISPLARKNEKNPLITDRFELIIAGMEMANAFSELNDAVDQRERFEAQAQRKAAGDEEACDVDEDFLRAIEYGMPPTGGEGIGIDRLVMLLTNSHSIRDVLLFPQLKPKEASNQEGEEQEGE